MRELQSGQQVPVEVVRDGTTRTVTVTLASRTENATTAPQNDDTTPDSTQPNNIPDLNDLFGQRPGRRGNPEKNKGKVRDLRHPTLQRRHHRSELRVSLN